MTAVTPKALLEFAKGLKRKKLHTLAKRRPFKIKKVDIAEGVMEFVTSRGKPQRASGRWLQETCEVFSDTKSLCPSDYRHTHGVTYALALIHLFNESQC